MSHLRGRVAHQCEAATRAALEDARLQIQDYGQGMLNDAAREMLRGVPTAERWKQDYLVRTPTGRTVLVDAKFSFDNTQNHSIEMRSLLVAGASDLPTFYVCSHWQVGGTFTEFQVLHYQEIMVIGPYSWPCCSECRNIFTGSDDPMRDLPERCPQQKRGTTASGTPFFVARPPFRPLTTHVFDMHPWFAVKPPGRKWDHNVVIRPAEGAA